MFGYDHDDLEGIIRSKLDTEHVYVQMGLHSTQATVAHEKDMLSKWSNAKMGNSIHICTKHLKLLIVDGVYLVTGSTNCLHPAKGSQDSECTCTIGIKAVRAAAARTVSDINHDFMPKQMAAKASPPAPVVTHHQCPAVAKARAVAVSFACEGADVLVSYLNEEDRAEDCAGGAGERTCLPCYAW
jgi:hypothetical protein